MKRWIKTLASEETDEWAPFSQGTYRVQGGYSNIKYTDNPKTAISYWFRFQKKDPMDVAISCATREQAIDLCKVATSNLIYQLFEKYGDSCPYDPDWIVSEASKKVADGQKYFYEGKYGYGDSIHPFGVG